MSITKWAEGNGSVVPERISEAKNTSAGILWAVLAVAWILLPVLLPGPALARDLTGEITAEELYLNTPVYEQNTRAFAPDAESTKRIGLIDRNLKIIVFLGTWCPDSTTEIPRLLKIVEAAHNPNISLELHAVDRSIEDGAGFALQYGVRRVPTMIFMRDGEELGRIIEHPQGAMEEAVLAIFESER